MIFYLLLVIGSGFIILASIVTLIIGFIKKNRKTLITAGILFLIGTGGSIISTITYTKKVVEYVGSAEFQRDAKDGATLIGQTLGSAGSGLSNGVSSTLDEEAVNALASKSAIIFGKVTKTVASNFDSTLGSTNIYMDQTLKNSGMVPGRADEKYNAKTNDLEIFIDYKKDFTGKLRVTNYDQQGLKIEVVEKTVKAKAGQGKVEVFNFEHSGFGLTTYFIISKE